MCTNAMQGRRGYERDHLAGAGRLLAAYVFGDVLRAADPLEYAELDVGLGAPACGARLLRRLRLVPCTSRSAGTQGFSGSQRTGKGIPLNVRSMRRLWPNSSLPETSTLPYLSRLASPPNSAIRSILGYTCTDVGT